jgi:flagellar motor protein MotB
MSAGNIRQDGPYRRGLVLGLTIAEVMILVIFCLLLALTAMLAAREQEIASSQKRISELERTLASAGEAARLYDLVQQRYPQSKSSDDYFKELTADLEAADALDEMIAQAGSLQDALENAKIGAQLKQIAADNGVSNTQEFAEAVVARTRDEVEAGQVDATAAADAEIGKRVRQAADAAGVADLKAFVDALIEIASSGDAAKVVADAKSVLARDKNGGWPPFINLSEAGGFFFESGSAELRADALVLLEGEIIDRLIKLVEDSGADVVEVIGHTDEVPMSGGTSLDRALIAASRGDLPVSALRSSDNAGLGMARAVSVVRVLRTDPRLAGVKILPLSGAQMIVPIDTLADGTQSGNVQERRRIEIRVRRSTEVASAP